MGEVLAEMLTGDNHFFHRGRLGPIMPKTVEDALSVKLEGRRKTIEALQNQAIDPRLTELVSGLLELDSAKRLTIDQALASPCMKKVKTRQ